MWNLRLAESVGDGATDAVVATTPAGANQVNIPPLFQADWSDCCMVSLFLLVSVTHEHFE
jgi:hypothetical protein